MRRKRAVPSFFDPGRFCLEPTYSPAQVGEYLGLSVVSVQALINLGEKYKAALHPQLGGLWPTFKFSRRRRITLRAIDRHLEHMARLNGVCDPEARHARLVEIRYVEALEAPAAHA